MHKTIKSQTDQGQHPGCRQITVVVTIPGDDIRIVLLSISSCSWKSTCIILMTLSVSQIFGPTKTSDAVLPAVRDVSRRTGVKEASLMRITPSMLCSQLNNDSG